MFWSETGDCTGTPAIKAAVGGQSVGAAVLTPAKERHMLSNLSYLSFRLQTTHQGVINKQLLCSQCCALRKYVKGISGERGLGAIRLLQPSHSIPFRL